MARIYVVSSPSGGGKTTLCNRLLAAKRGLIRSVSVTTRRPRRGEVDGEDYFFVSQREFRRLKREGGLLEWTEYARSFYGTPLKPLKELLVRGKDVILLLDVRGAREVKKRFKDAITIFLLPPTLSDLRKRLAGRRTEGKSELTKRLRIAEKEMTQVGSYDYVVINDDLNRALRALQGIVRKDR